VILASLCEKFVFVPLKKLFDISPLFSLLNKARFNNENIKIHRQTKIYPRLFLYIRESFSISALFYVYPRKLTFIPGSSKYIREPP